MSVNRKPAPVSDFCHSKSLGGVRVAGPTRPHRTSPGVVAERQQFACWRNVPMSAGLGDDHWPARLRSPSLTYALSSIFVGGFTRLRSWQQRGRPHPVTVAAVVLEIAAPPLLIAWQRRILSRSTPQER